MKNWSPWIPYPRSWISAIFLCLILSGLVKGAGKVLQAGYYLSQHLPRLDAMFGVLAILSPIFFIAIIHHFLNLLLDVLLPNNELLKLDKVQGLNPGLISWWKGLYSWLVIVLATILTIGILDILLIEVSSVKYLYNGDRRDLLLSVTVIVWVTVAAYLYQFEHLVKRSVVATAKSQ
ncbi:hypothetical protein [Aliterella atlantica]|uniref:Uncharacterized protein n=1 Tax=Aliterella atlantica CENA595 TaxID=1618023 RepID=A0A0D8ZQ28_9CYAN|nr:hypothetical protein [Aliterella atlantica]KJH70452.1 hypothetical protein UH38_17690 [Aliterella atlantica CENA595]